MRLLCCALHTIHPQEFNTPKKERVVTEKKSPIHGVVMGAGEHSYLMRGGQIDVIKNSAGRMKDTGLSFMLTPPPKAAGWGGAGTPTLTPSKALLMDSVSAGAGRQRGSA